MKRFMGLFVILVCSPLWAQTSWKGQAEVWSDATLPLDGFYVASDQFPRNTVLIVENYKTKKSVQVRVVSGLPEGSACLVKLSPKAASALGMAAGDSAPVSVQIDTSLEGYLASGGDQSWKTDTSAPSNPATAEVESPAQTPAVVPLAAPLAPAVASAPATSPSEPLPLDDSLPSVPTAPASDSRVFLTPPPSNPQVSTSTTSANTPPSSTPALPMPPSPAAPVPEPAATVVTPSAPPVALTSAVPPVPPTPTAPPSTPAPAIPELGLAPSLGFIGGWASRPGRLRGDVLGTIQRVNELKGKPYVRLAAFSEARSLVSALKTVKSFVPLTVITGGKGKEAFILAAQADKSQLGVLLLLFRSQGYPTAYVVKG